MEPVAGPSPEPTPGGPELVRGLLNAPRPHLYALRSVKRVLADELGPDEAALAYAGLTGWEVDAVQTLPVISLAGHAARHAAVHDEMGGGREVEIPPVPVYGENPEPAGRAVARSFAFCVLEDALVTSKSSFVLSGDAALLDFQGAELRDVPVDLDVDPIVASLSGNEATVVRVTPSRELPQALSMVGVHSYNFGHWLIEFLPRLLAALRRPGFESVPVLVDAQMPPQHLEALGHFAGPEQPVIVLEPGEAVRVQRLWLSSSPSYVPVGLRPGVRGVSKPRHIMDDAALAALMASPPPEVHGDGPLLYLTRTDEQHRRMVNRGEVEAWFTARGFRVLEFGALPFEEQLSAIRAADVIVGSAGSSMLFASFAGPGKRVGVLSNEYVEDSRWLAFACRGVGQRLSVLRGETVADAPDYEMFSEFRIPVGALPAFVEDLTSAG